MKRWHDEEKITKRNWKNHLDMHRQSTIDRGGNVEGVCNHHQAGRFRKKDAYDCGKTQCRICHWDKIKKIKHRSVEKADASYKEQIGEL